jgi:hypothetical protein
MRAVSRFWAVLCLLLTTAHAHADELELTIERATHPCAAAPIVNEVEAVLGRALRPGPPVLRAHLSWGWTGGHVTILVDLERQDGRSQRRLEARGCTAAERTVALVIALALDPSPSDDPVPIADAPPEPEAARTPGVEADRAPEPAPVPVASTMAPSTPRTGGSEEPFEVRFSAMFGGIVDGGSFPAAEVGLRSGIAIGLGPARLELAGTYLAMQRAATSQPGASIEVMAAYGTLRAGGALRLVERLELVAAVELDVGAAVGRGLGARVVEIETVAVPWVSVRLATWLELVVEGPFSVRLTGSLGTPLVAPTFEITGSPGVLRPAPVLGQGGLDVMVHVP